MFLHGFQMNCPQLPKYLFRGDARFGISEGFFGQADQLGIVPVVWGRFFAVQSFEAGADHLVGALGAAGLHPLLDALTQRAKIDGDKVGCCCHGNLV
jgi:hypothetical protein